jgi:hypothetical protein
VHEIVFDGIFGGDACFERIFEWLEVEDICELQEAQRNVRARTQKKMKQSRSCWCDRKTFSRFLSLEVWSMTEKQLRSHFKTPSNSPPFPRTSFSTFIDAL